MGKPNIKQLKNKLYPYMNKKYKPMQRLDKLSEECDEFIEALQNYKENASVNSLEALLSELADVTIMAEQLNIDFPETRHQVFKLQRQIDREGI